MSATCPSCIHRITEDHINVCVLIVFCYMVRTIVVRESLTFLRGIFVISSFKHKLIRVDLTMIAWTTRCGVRTIMHLSLFKKCGEALFFKDVICLNSSSLFGSVAHREDVFEIWNARNGSIQKLDALSFATSIMRDHVTHTKLIGEM